MNRVGSEKISQSPLTFKSVFSVSTSAFSTISQNPIKSETSGLGWTFCVMPASPPTAAIGQPVSRRGKKGRHSQAKDTTVLPDAESSPIPSLNAILHLELEPTTLALSGQLMFDRIVCQVTSTNDVLTKQTWYSLQRQSSSTPRGTSQLSLSPSSSGCYQQVHRWTRSCSFGGLARVWRHPRRESIYLLEAVRIPQGQPMYINSAILHKFGCDDLDSYFTAKGFGESKPTVLDLHHISSEDSVTDEYDYDSDSDLEEEDDETVPDVKPETRGTNELAEDLMLIQGETNERFLRTGRVVFLRATAYRTFAAFMRFVYFDKITYAKLKSTYTDDKAALARFSDKTCSPKSMYRFADYFGIEKLQKSALESIQEQLTVDNIVKELFSEFSSHHPKVIDIEVAFLKKNFENQKIRDGLQDIALRACDGERYMAAALRKVFAEMTVTPPAVCSVAGKCQYNTRCSSCGSYHMYHHN